MIEREVIVTTKHGRMPCHAFCPDEPGRFPAIILYMDALGMREELLALARRAANAGYFCLLPDLYYRIGTIRFDTARRTDAMASVWRACYLGTTNAFVVDDTAGMLAWLDGQDKVKPGAVGCFGYCMSGQYVVSVAARFPHRIAAAFAGQGRGRLHCSSSASADRRLA